MHIKPTSLPLIWSLCRKIDKSIKKFWIHKCVKILIKYNRSRIWKTIWDTSDIEKTQDILKNKWVLIVANHNFDMEMIPLLNTLPERKDFYMVASSNFLQIWENLSSHLIPIYFSNKKMGTWNKFSWKVLNILKKSNTNTNEQNSELNRKSMERVVELLNKNAMILIFPSWIKWWKHESWSDWIWYLINDLKKLENKEIYLTKAFIKWHSIFDLLRFFKYTWLFLPKLTVHIKEPKLIKNLDLNDELHPKSITKILQDVYSEWIKKYNQKK